MTPPTIGRIVHYHSKAPLGATVPAIVTVTEETYQDGVWVEPAPQAPDTWSRDAFIINGQHSMLGADGRQYVSPTIPKPEPGRAHLCVFGPQSMYYELNVAEGDAPGEWSWPVIRPAS